MNISVTYFNDTVVTIMMLATAILTVMLGCYVMVKSQKRGMAKWFAVSLALLLIWNLCYLFRRYAPNETVRWVLVLVETAAVVFVAPTSYFFGRSLRGLKNALTPFGYIIIGLALIFLISAISNPLHHLFFKEFNSLVEVPGPIINYMTLYISICFCISSYHFYRSFNQPSIYWKQQLWYLGGAVMLPVFAAIFQSLDIMKVDVVLPLVVLPLSIILMSIAVMKYQFLDILPLALSESVESIDDGFVVISLDGNIEDYNKVFFDRFFSIDKCKSIDELIILFRSVVENRVALNNIRYSINVRNDNYVSGELILRIKEDQVNLQYTTKAINDMYGVKIATIITFHDISEIQNLYKTLESKKNELMEAKKRLEDHVETVQMLTIETERNKLMAEVHDTLGHTMAEVLALLEKCDIALSQEHFELDKAKIIIEEGAARARESLTEIRAAVTKFKEMGVK